MNITITKDFILDKLINKTNDILVCWNNMLIYLRNELTNVSSNKNIDVCEILEECITVEKKIAYYRNELNSLTAIRQNMGMHLVSASSSSS